MFETHEAYFATLAPGVRERMELIQQEVERRVPGAQRCIGYQMPAFRQRRIFFYFAAFQHHIGVYPPLSDDPALIAESARFRGPKGNLRCPLEADLPIDLIGRLAQALAVQYAADPGPARSWPGSRVPGLRGAATLTRTPLPRRDAP